MPESLPSHIVQVDSRVIRIGDRTVLTTFPIDHLTMVDDGLLLAVENYGEEEWLYQSFTLEADGVVLGTRRLFGGVVRRGTRLAPPSDDNRGLVLPSGTKVRLPRSAMMLIAMLTSRVAAKVLLLLLATMAASIASPEDLVAPMSFVCAPAPVFLGIANTVTRTAPQGTGEIAVERSNGQMSVSSEGASSASVVTAAGDAAACEAYAPATKLLDGGTVPRVELASLDAVMSYKTTHVWPYGDADLADPRTAIFIQMRGRRALVFIRAYKTLQSLGGLSCRGEEAYRVDPGRGFAVLPFEQCAEVRGSHDAFPSLKDLPDR